MKANGKKPLKSYEKHNGVRSESLCKLTIEINLALSEAVRASDDLVFCDVHVTQFDVTWQLLDFYAVVCHVVADLDC